ncbi:hypothetical protein OSG_eHP27_00050 [environmental Halophage eHP-27]|nr:hypothetical protein OSG_eHP27_00050 [environmental Halophage eHP-27]
MSHARLTHPTRPTLEFIQGQQDEYNRDAVANIVREIGTDRTSLVHTETREGRRTIRGSVSGLRRARNDTSTSDARQALANYVDELEAHVDEFQGDPGYQLVDDQLGYSKSAILESVEWSVTPGQIYEFDYEASAVVGQGVFESKAIDRRNPTVNTSLDTMLRIDGEDLPGMRDYRVRREIGVTTNAVFNRDTAENNDIVPEDGPQQTVAFEGLISGTLSERQTKDAALDALVATRDPITLETYFPGYSLDGYVTAYNSTLEQQRAGNSHRYRIEFVEGQRA